MSYIAKFNPYSMDENTILAVATGRKKLLSQVLDILRNNYNSSSIAQHLVVRGPRGMGKSFFMKYLMINFYKDEEFKSCDFLLLPEEQSNINSPSDLIKLILNQLNGDSGSQITTFWEEPEDVWQVELNKLNKYLEQKRKEFGKYLLVVVVENLNDFLKNIQNDKQTRNVNESRFRHLLEKLNNLTIIGATPTMDASSIDGDYNSRLFHAFKKCNLRPWTEEDCFKYFERRKVIKAETQKIEFTETQTAMMKVKLKALSHYTGGSPRLAMVLTNLLLNEDVISTVRTLFGLIDDLTPYYQDLIKSIPPKSRILFDALIRNKENLSQSELAEIVGASQSKISRAFTWLKENGYIIGHKRINSSAFSYQVADRIFVLFYQLREVHHNQNVTPIWLLSDFLVAFYQEDELKTYANKCLKEQPGIDANEIAKVYLLATGLYEKSQIPNYDTSEDWLKIINKFTKLDNGDFEVRFEGEEEILKYLHLKHENSKKENNVLSEITSLLMISSYMKQFDRMDESYDKLQAAGLLVESIKELAEKGTFLMVIGLFWSLLGKCEESNQYYQRAYSIAKDTGDIAGQRLNLRSIGVNLSRLGRYDESIEFHRKALQINENANKDFYQAYSLGQIGANYILLKQWDKALDMLEPKGVDNERIIKELGDAVAMAEANENLSKAFEIGNQLLQAIKEREGWLNVGVSLSNMFADLLNMKISSSLFIDLCENALSIFESKETQIIINAALHTAKYVEAGKDEAYLEKLDPDMVIAIKAIVEEAEL